MKNRETLSEVLSGHEHTSPLYLEKPTEQARVVVRRPEFQKALHYRLTQALYENRNIPEILFPNLPGTLPTFDQYINADVFADEEAVEIDRFIRADLSSDTASPQEVQAVIDKLLASGELKPSSRVEIDREEKWRRHLMTLVTAFQKEEYVRAEEIAKELSRATQGKDGENLADHFRNILTPLIENTLEPLLHQKKYADLLEILHMASLCTFIPSAEFAAFAHMITRYPEVRSMIGTGLLRKLFSEKYDEIWGGLRSYGIPEPFIRECIYPHIGDFITHNCKGKDGVDLKKLLEIIEKLKSRNLLPEKWIHESVLLTLLRYIADSVIGKEGWAENFSDMKKHIHERNLFTADEFEHHPIVRECAKQYLVKSFGRAYHAAHLEQAMNEIIDARIYTRKEIGELPELLAVADGYLIELCGDEQYRKDLFDSLTKKYIALGLGNLTRFRNLPAIKRGREAIEKK